MSQATTSNGRAGALVPPHNLEAEASVLGSLLLDPDAILRVLDLVDPEDFYRENHGQVYRAAVTLFRAGEAIDNVTVAAELERMGVLDRVGGRAQLAMLQEAVPTAANVEHYGAIVKDRAYKRRLIAAAKRGTELGYDDSLTGEEAVNQAQADVYALTADRPGTGMQSIYDVVKATMTRVDALQAGRGVVGMKTGFRDLDLLTNGLQPTDLVVVAGRPSMGKTAMTLQIAANVAMDADNPRAVAIFSLEMSEQQLGERLLCARAGVDSERLRRGILSEVEYDRLTSWAGPVGDAKLFIDDGPLDDLSLRLKARQAKVRHDVGLIVVDYLQLMESRGGGPRASRVEAVSAISRTLKSIAKELDIPVLAVSQLSRGPELRPDKRPILSDLRDSGEIEQAADLVLFLYRDDYYNREKSAKPGVAEVDVAKHRNGRTGVVELLFRRELTRFDDLEKRRDQGEQ
jgi:replicative DNA helicase